MRRFIALGLLVAVFPAAAVAAQSDTAGRTTVDQRLDGGKREAGRFNLLQRIAGQPYRVREDLAQAGGKRARKRRSVAQFAQLSDFQLADEESPARVEFLDALHPAASSAHRPHEALMPFVVDASIRQVNALKDTSPVQSGDHKRAPISFAITTGDNADNQQYNETEWVATLLNGGVLNPNSGSPNPADYAACPHVAVESQPIYTGVQDYDDYPESVIFYDPDDPKGDYASWPRWPGLLDRAQQPFTAAGLQIPSYVAVGNHDLLVQGNEDANAGFEAIATGCQKVMYTAVSASDLIGGFDPAILTTNPQRVADTAPDPKRRFVTAPEYRALYGQDKHGTSHGFAHVDKAEADASNGAANYYSFSPRPGLRMVAMDSVANGGITFQTDRGNIDDPQYKWLEKTLKAAEVADELVVVYSHHGPQSMDANVPDEVAGRCTGRPDPADEPNPGCDLDPRNSQPLHLAGSMVELLHRFPSVVAWVAGHSHVNDVVPFKREGGGFWVVRTSAEADWPHQDRLVEIMDNRDGTLSLFGTLIDNAAPSAIPPGGPASGFGPDELASIGRTLGFNDPQNGGGTGETEQTSDGKDSALDQNVELLIGDPRRSSAKLRDEIVVSRPRSGVRVRLTPRRLRAGRTTRLRLLVTVDGRAARKAAVTAGRRTARTDRRGRATVRVRPARSGTLRVVVAVKGRGKTVVRVPVRR